MQNEETILTLLKKQNEQLDKIIKKQARNHFLTGFMLSFIFVYLWVKFNNFGIEAVIKSFG